MHVGEDKKKAPRIVRGAGVAECDPGAGDVSAYR